jgi:hypothetical protein
MRSMLGKISKHASRREGVSTRTPDKIPDECHTSVLKWIMLVEYNYFYAPEARTIPATGIFFLPRRDAR